MSYVVTVRPGRVVFEEHIWSTVVTVDALVEDSVEVREGLRRVSLCLREVDEVFSTFKENSWTSRFRRGEVTLEGCPEVFLEVHTGCVRAREITGGAFDPWKVPGGFDPSGFVKGFAADRVASILQEHGVHNFMVNAGGDLTCRGEVEGGPWPIGISDPRDTSKVVKVMGISNAAVATSGSYERGEHIIDPQTGLSAPYLLSASVIGPDGGLADALATALVVSGKDGASWFTNLPGWSLYLVEGDIGLSWGPAFL
jgi:thiamine biosynthesis lipoprotein